MIIKIEMLGSVRLSEDVDFVEVRYFEESSHEEIQEILNREYISEPEVFSEDSEPGEIADWVIVSIHRSNTDVTTLFAVHNDLDFSLKMESHGKFLDIE